MSSIIKQSGDENISYEGEYSTNSAVSYGGNYTLFPYSTIGRLFFIDTRTGLGQTCSGAVLASSQGNMIWTAAHCLKTNGGGVATNIEFVPAYKDGARPFGTWVACGVYPQPSYVPPPPEGTTNTAIYNYDYGAIKACTNSGATISSVVGALGIAVNQGTGPIWTAAGYPGNPPYTGNSLYTCLSPYTGVSGGNYGMNCGLTANGGMSGGPWILSTASGLGIPSTNPNACDSKSYIINGVSSFVVPPNENVIYTPYFNQTVFDFYQYLVATVGV